MTWKQQGPSKALQVTGWVFLAVITGLVGLALLYVAMGVRL